jgi:phasin
MEKSAMDPKMTIVPEVVREAAEQAFEQTEKAFDAFLSAANKSVAMFPSPATDMSTKTLALTERNLKAAFEYARKLLHAKDMQEIMQIQGDFFKNQLAAAEEQMKQMGSRAVSAAKDVAQDVNKS